jgi:tRNA nucleotidyltransferase/poly(A) polymerase
MPKFASETTVPVEKTKSEIEKILRNYGAHAFLSGYQNDIAFVQFIASTKHVKFTIKLPTTDDFKFDKRNHIRPESHRESSRDQEHRRRWRALLLVLKAKLEAVQSGISSFEEEFLAHIVLPNGTTVGQWMLPQVEETYRTGQMPNFLPGLPPHEETKE